jgi:valyl-tRNA synthetase
MNVIEKYGADALRYWAASKKFGEDVNYSEKELSNGKKTVVKLWNAARFALMHLEGYCPSEDVKLSHLDKWLLAELNQVIKDATLFFEQYDFSKSKAEVERFFWNDFCDNYLEIIKDRLYNSDNYAKEEVESAKYTLYNAILATLKLFAPFLVHISEEIYQSFFKEFEKHKSIHLAKWPNPKKEWENKDALNSGRALLSVISAVRRYKALNNLSMKAELPSITITLPKAMDLSMFEREIKNTLHVKVIDIEEGEEIGVKDVKQ